MNATALGGYAIEAKQAKPFVGYRTCVRTT